MIRSATSSLRPARIAGLLGLLVLGSALPGAAQIRQAPPPVKRPEPGKIQPLPAGPVGDLVITAVTVQDVPIPTPSTTARVTVQNKGAAAVTFPAGSVLARGDAAQAGGIAFQPMTTPVDYEIATGQSTVLTLTVGDPCAAGKAGTVTFRADPDNKVRESDEGNNSSTVNGVGSFVTGDLQAAGVYLETTAPGGNDKDTGGVPAGYPAALSVTFRNVGTGPVLLCPGVALWRETASPVSSKYGLRTTKNEGTAVKVYPPGVTMISKLAGAYATGDLPPGSYTWSVLVNPDGGMRETSSANNAATTTVKIR
jgi:hypothetical protein